MRGFFWHHGRRHHHCERDGDAAHPGFGPGGYSEEQARAFASDMRERWGGRHRGRHHHHGEGWQAAGDFDGDGGFGVRRPLRFMANKLELSEEQIGELAVILHELKTERAQAAVDQRRSINSFAEALVAEAFDEAKAESAGTERVKSADQVRQAVQKALRKVHALLDADQRQRLAYLMRTGALSI